MKELDEDRELARQLKQPSAAIAATVAQAKLAGCRSQGGRPAGRVREHEGGRVGGGFGAERGGVGAEGVGEKPQ